MKKNLFIVLTIIICILTNSISFATATVTTGTVAEECILTFRVGYIGDTFKSDVIVTLEDIANENNKYQFILKQSEGFNANKEYTILANTTYKVSLSYSDSDNYSIVNADNTIIESYAATSSNLELVWQIKEITETDKLNKTEETKTVKTVIPHSEDKSNMNVLENFVEKTKFIAEDENYKNFLNNWSNATFQKLYEAEENLESWDSMTSYEKACYSLLFLAPKSRILGANSSMNASDLDTFLKGLSFAQTELKNIDNGNVVYDEIVNVWKWHWENWNTKRTFLNPYELEKEKTSISESKSEEVSTSTQAKDETIENKEVNNNSVLSIITSNIITIILLIIVGIIILIVYLRRK